MRTYSDVAADVIKPESVKDGSQTFSALDTSYLQASQNITGDPAFSRVVDALDGSVGC